VGNPVAVALAQVGALIAVQVPRMTIETQHNDVNAPRDQEVGVYNRNPFIQRLIQSLFKR
jgi:hypothetical protein